MGHRAPEETFTVHTHLRPGFGREVAHVGGIEFAEGAPVARDVTKRQLDAFAVCGKTTFRWQRGSQSYTGLASAVPPECSEHAKPVGDFCVLAMPVAEPEPTAEPEAVAAPVRKTAKKKARSKKKSAAK